MKTIEFIPTNYDSDLTDTEWAIIEKYFSRYGIIDSQSTKTVSASEKRGIDGGKKGKGA